MGRLVKGLVGGAGGRGRWVYSNGMSVVVAQRRWTSCHELTISA